MTSHTYYDQNGRRILVDCGEPARVGDELEIDGKWYRVQRAVRRYGIVPPDGYELHLIDGNVPLVFPLLHP